MLVWRGGEKGRREQAWFGRQGRGANNNGVSGVKGLLSSAIQDTTRLLSLAFFCSLSLDCLFVHVCLFLSQNLLACPLLRFHFLHYLPSPRSSLLPDEGNITAALRHLFSTVFLGDNDDVNKPSVEDPSEVLAAVSKRSGDQNRRRESGRVKCLADR